MHTLLVTDVVPPTPSIWRGSGDPNADKKILSQSALSSGRSDFLKYKPRDVPPRIKVAGILVCIAISYLSLQGYT